MTIVGRSGASRMDGAPRLSLRDRVLGVRDSILANQGFQRFAAAFGLTRPIARQRAGALFDLVAGFVYSQILLACVRLRLFDHLAKGPQTLVDLARRMALTPDATALLLDAAVSLKLAQARSGGRYGLGPLGAALIGNPGVAAMIEHHAMFYGDLRDPVALLRGETAPGELAAYWPYAGRDTPANLSRDSVEPYTTLMAASQPMIAQEVLRAHSFRDYRCLLDVGGGDGSFLTAVARHAPDLKLMLFDLPAVADRARANFLATGLSSRATATGGGFLSDQLPQGADAVSLVRVLHDHDDADVMTLLRAIRQILPPDGKLIVAEPLAGTAGAGAVADAYFAFYLLAMGRGRPRTFARLREMLADAGFGDVTLRPTAMPMLARVITATRPTNSLI